MKIGQKTLEPESYMFLIIYHKEIQFKRTIQAQAFTFLRQEYRLLGHCKQKMLSDS